MSVITAVTAQNARRVRAVREMPADFVDEQLEAVFAGATVDAVKTGMLASADIVRVVAVALREQHVATLVVDPVIMSTSGARLLSEDALEMLRDELLPLARVVTPNLAETAELAGTEVCDVAGMKRAARKIHDMGVANVLITGGHLGGDPVDVLYDGSDFTILAGSRAARADAHGSGCVHSSAIAALLAMGVSVPEAAREAKRLLALALDSPAGSDVGVSSVDAHAWCEHSGERAAVLASLRAAVGRLARARLGWLVPEVRANLGYALPFATTRAEVAAFPGRLTALDGQHVAVAAPTFGASRHIASVILAAMAHDGGRRAAMNIRYSPAVLEACRPAGLRSVAFDRHDEPDAVRRREGSTLEWGTDAALARAGGVVDVVHDRGGFGKEPMIRVLGKHPEDVVDKVIRIAASVAADASVHEEDNA